MAMTNKGGNLMLSAATLSPSRPFPLARAERHRKKAAECEHAAQTLSDPATRFIYLDLAKHWQDLARQAEMLDRERGDGR
jgi:hypothetical protein